MHAIQSRYAGEMLILGNHDPKLGACLDTIAVALHPSFDRLKMLPADYSRMSCIQASLTVRDFLVAQGIRAIVAPVRLIVTITQLDKPQIVYTIGQPENHAPKGGEWKGHLITLCDGGFLIDTTLYRTTELQPKRILAMAAVPAASGPLLAHMAAAGEGFKVDIGWIRTPANMGWTIGDSKNTARFRATVVKALLREHARRHHEKNAASSVAV